MQFDNVGTEECFEDGWLQAMNEHTRERQLYDALDECHAKGLSKKSMLTLLYETGARWDAPEHRRG